MMNVFANLHSRPSATSQGTKGQGYEAGCVSQSSGGLFASLKSRIQNISKKQLLLASVGALCVAGTLYWIYINSQIPPNEEVASDICQIYGNMSSGTLGITRVNIPHEEVASDICQEFSSTCSRTLGITRVNIPNEEVVSDICQEFSSMCRGHLGISRENMPQLEDSVLEGFLQTNPYSCESIPVKFLTPVQNEGNLDKIWVMIQATVKGVRDACTNPILISEENYVLDGHHRFWACSFLDRSISVLRLLNLNVNQSLWATDTFPGLEHHQLGFFYS